MAMDQKGDSPPGTPWPLSRRFPAAAQYLRMRLLDEVFPIAPWIQCLAVPLEAEAWEVSLRWPELDFESRERFEARELRAVYGRWSDWARRQVFAIADKLPV